MKKRICNEGEKEIKVELRLRGSELQTRPLNEVLIPLIDEFENQNEVNE